MLEIHALFWPGLGFKFDLSPRVMGVLLNSIEASCLSQEHAHGRLPSTPNPTTRTGGFGRGEPSIAGAPPTVWITKMYWSTGTSDKATRPCKGHLLLCLRLIQRLNFRMCYVCKEQHTLHIRPVTQRCSQGCWRLIFVPFHSSARCGIQVERTCRRLPGAWNARHVSRVAAFSGAARSDGKRSCVFVRPVCFRRFRYFNNALFLGMRALSKDSIAASSLERFLVPRKYAQQDELRTPYITPS